MEKPVKPHCAVYLGQQLLLKCNKCKTGKRVPNKIYGIGTEKWIFANIDVSFHVQLNMSFAKPETFQSYKVIDIETEMGLLQCALCGCRHFLWPIPLVPSWCSMSCHIPSSVYSASSCLCYFVVLVARGHYLFKRAQPNLSAASPLVNAGLWPNVAVAAQEERYIFITSTPL